MSTPDTTIDANALNPDGELAIFGDYPLSITFHNDSKQVGRLWFERDEGVMKFEGDLDDSAKRLFEFTASQWDAVIRTLSDENERLRQTRFVKTVDEKIVLQVGSQEIVLLPGDIMGHFLDE